MRDIIFKADEPRDNDTRRVMYEYKKFVLRMRTQGWPETPPDDLDALPESVKWWWRALTALRNEHRRASRGMAVLRFNPRRAGPKVTVLQPMRKAQ